MDESEISVETDGLPLGWALRWAAIELTFSALAIFMHTVWADTGMVTITVMYGVGLGYFVIAVLAAQRSKTNTIKTSEIGVLVTLSAIFQYLGIGSFISGTPMSAIMMFVILAMQYGAAFAWNRNFFFFVSACLFSAPLALVLLEHLK